MGAQAAHNGHSGLDLGAEGPTPPQPCRMQESPGRDGHMGPSGDSVPVVSVEEAQPHGVSWAKAEGQEAVGVEVSP